MFSGVEMDIVNLKDANQYVEVEAYLAQFGLTFDQGVEYTVNFRQAGKIVGTGSFEGGILRNIALDKSMRGSGLVSTIVTALMQEQARRGRFHYFVFTKPCTSRAFEKLGFTEIVRAEPYVSLLETGIGSVAVYCDRIEKSIAHPKGERGAVVVNGNPFTKGHRALIQQASMENDMVIVFVVREERTLLPFVDRLKLVREGVSDMDNVTVVPGSKYFISPVTFPAYFLREDDKAAAQARLDSILFATQIAPRLGIKKRYIGEEPYCPVTNAYNQAMLDILPDYGISVKIMNRLLVDGEMISSSRVRHLIQQGVWNDIKKLVPDRTYDYLTSAVTKVAVDRDLILASPY
ncbi:[citrate (pro-3S)-lyase] ligase [Ammoniphilus sp. 3BR4]|uniref:[citrate (pro-3S)-lyase] ligase n=1 Tax=Ammoniphilus sp. 3BR4 TaxID=3158265 RepID=UPI00346700C6